MDFREKLVKLLNDKSGIKADFDKLLEIPPKLELGDFALPCFQFAKTEKKSPVKIAEELALKLPKTNFIENIVPTGPYLNFFIKPEKIAKSVLTEINEKKSDFGKGKKKKEKIMVEYSQPNTHKAFHIGHLRGTSLGESLARIFEYSGHDVVRANYSGDTGAHVGKWLWYFEKHCKKKWPDKDIAQWIASIYVNAVKKTTDNEEASQEAQRVNFKLEQGFDPNLNKLWLKTRLLSIKGFNKIYSDLDVKFDEWFFESEMEKPAKNIVNDLIKSGIAEISQKVPIINLEKYKLGVWVLLREDGTSLYSSKDLALAKIKFEKYKIDRSIYVVGNAQSLHLKQLFKTLELMKFKQAEKCYHLSYDEVRLPTGKMSSRTGVNILYEDMFKQMFDHARKETKKRHPEWGPRKLDNIAQKITISALKYGMLSQDNNKKIVFDSVKALEFEGDTGPYLLYTYARASSILKKSKTKRLSNIDFASYKTTQERNLIKSLADFKIVLDCSEKNFKPCILANYLMNLAHSFNEFYHNCSCISEDKCLTRSRLLLVRCFRIVYALCLDLLGMPVIEEM